LSFSTAPFDLSGFCREYVARDTLNKRWEILFGTQWLPANAIEKPNAIAANREQRLVNTQFGQ
jgi:hypothetical protein